MKNRYQLTTACIITIGLLLSACSHPIYHSAQNQIDDVRTQIATAKDNYAYPKEPGGKFGVYRQAQKYIQNPAWLKRNVSIHVKEASFEFVAEKIVAGTAAVTAFEPDINTQKTISLNYRGTVKGALRALEAKSGYGSSVNLNTLTWSQYINKTFDISFMPGASTYLLGQHSSTSASSNSNGSSATAVNGAQFSNLKASLSVWEDLNRTLHQLKSKQGKVFVSQATTTVTVQDKPAQVRAIENYLNSLNKKLSREVALQVQVLEVDLNRGFNYGVDWQLVRNYMDVQFGLVGALGKPVSLMSLGSNANDSAAGFIIQSTAGKWAGTDMLINALSQQGKISTVTRPRVVTLNNQVAQIDINTQTGYLREVTTTTVGAASTSTTSLTPGTVKTGFSLFLLPKIQRQDVYLQISSTISTLLGITNIKANPSMFAPNNTQIQLPTVAEKRFNQRSVVPSGATLVLAGFKQIRNDANSTKMFKATALGSRGAQQTNTETIVLITPTVIGRS